MSAVDESEALHQRVRSFAESGGSDAAFDELALALARFQAAHCPGFAKLVERSGRALDTVDSIPAVPSDAFRLTRVAVHAPELDSARFVTSGTTGSERGMHAFRTTTTYERLALAFGRRALVAGPGLRTVVALAPPPTTPQQSSLGFMMGLFMQSFDGRPLAGSEFSLQDPARWLFSAEGVDLRGLGRALEVSVQRDEPLLLLTTSFALVALLDALGSQRLPLPPGSVVMQTGGFKGRSRELEPEELRERTRECLGVRDQDIVGEYGMTELASQLYEGSAHGVELSGPSGVYLAPAWLRVTPVDPVELAAVADGEVGLARFVDLANIDSAVAIVTRDLVRRRGGGIELVGRAAQAPLRGCSLAIEALLEGAQA